MKLYEVGGAVRDALLGRPVNDRDWVAVGATPQQLLDAGYTPVGRDFPVFLHPRTREEVALARTERKTAPGYHGFAFHAAPDVTLEQDLARRDLTINAMARAEDGTLVDPHGGRRDLQARILRHVSPAFAEDPVRILRLARFAARFTDFRVADETLALMRAMVAAGEVDALVPERVWQELSRGLGEAQPSRMLQVLRDCGALARLLPELDRDWAAGPAPTPGERLQRRVDRGAARGAPLPVQYALLSCAVEGGGSAAPAAEGAAIRPRGPAEPRTASAGPRRQEPRGTAATPLAALAERLRVPTDCRELADTFWREQRALDGARELPPDALLRLLERCDAFRKPERFGLLLQAWTCAAPTRSGAPAEPDAVTARWCEALAAARTVDTAGVAAAAAAAGHSGPAVGEAIRRSRAAAIGRALGRTD
jgi:tRNA nucleotidyltransferase (CCA-adding enzyme)